MKYLWAFAPLRELLLTGFALLVCFSNSSAQNIPPTEEALATAKNRLNLTQLQTTKLHPLLKERLNVLRKLASGHITANETLWRELLNSRLKFEDGLQRILTPEQLRLVPELLAEFEQTTLESWRERQFSVISSRLRLTPEQTPAVRSILDQDFDQKVVVIRSYRKHRAKKFASFERALEIINEDTTANLKRILTARQLAEFGRVSGQSNGSPPWLWGAVAAVDDRAGSGSVEASVKSPKKRGEFVIAPIPVINPTLENGLALGVGYLYHLNKDDLTSPPSITGVGGFRTSNGSRGFAFLQKFVLKQNKYRLLLVGGRADVNYNFFGIGAEAGNAGRSIPVEQSGKGFLIDGSMRLFSKWYVGVHYFLIKSQIGVDRSHVVPSSQTAIARGPQIPELELNLRTAGLGPSVEYDSRSDSFYPRLGSQFRFQMSFHNKSLGGRLNYETYQASFNKFFSLSSRQVIAVHAAGCYAAGAVPFYDLCIFGQSKDVRGYEVGRYLDRVMIASQAEYRVEFMNRVGAAAFFGAGEVARRFADLRSDALKPGGGVGLRFRLTKENHINLRVDYGWGIGSRGLYLGVTEAF